MTLTYVVLLILAVARVTRLVQRDDITERPRRWVQRHVSDRVNELLACPWCLSIWLAAPAAVVFVWWPTNRVVLVVYSLLAASHVTALLARLDPEPQLEDQATPDDGDLD